MLDNEQSSETTETQSDGGFDAVISEIEAMPLEESKVTEPAESSAAPASEATDPAKPTDAPAPSDTAPAADSTTAEKGDDSAPSAPAETPAADTPTHKPFTFTVDKREVALTGAVEDGKGNIIIPKETWHNEAKNFLADRSAIHRERQEWARERQQLTQERSTIDQMAGSMLQEMTRILGLPEAESFEEWEKLRAEFPKKKLEMENQILTQQRKQSEESQQQEVVAQATREHVVPRLQEHLKGAMAETLKQGHADVLKLVEKLPEADRAKVREAVEKRIYDALWDDALDGRIYYRTDQMVEIGGVRVPDVVPDLQRIAQVVRREVEGMREALDLRLKFAEIEAATRKNLEKEQQRKPATEAPPAISAKGTTPEPVKDRQPQSFDDVLEAAMNV